jgi:2-(1,2-epoxy-1,2-dihydrophenyl)acetyl-CoA isomerase
MLPNLVSHSPAFGQILKVELPMTAPALLFDHSGGILTLTLNRPDRLNALDLPHWDELAAAVVRARADQAIRAVVITGAGRAFCAGADIAGMRGERDAAGQIARLDRINAVIQALADLPKPVIAALNGVAAGIGASLALACDLIVAAENASLVCSWIKIGFVPDGGASWRLERALGPWRAKQLILTGRSLPAAEAHALGLLNEVVPAGAALDCARALAAEIAAWSPHAVRLSKALVDAAAMRSLAEQLAAEAQAQGFCVETAEHRAAVAAFFERKP